LFGVVGETVVAGKIPVSLERFGRPEMKNVIMGNKEFDQVNRDLEIRDLYNLEDAGVCIRRASRLAAVESSRASEVSRPVVRPSAASSSSVSRRSSRRRRVRRSLADCLAQLSATVAC
jgi:hypothetical protein